MRVDPSTFEIIRHKFFRVIDEATIALMNVSGSDITNEGHDLMVSLYRADGSLLMGGVGFLHHITSASHACKHILKEFSDDPGIDEGDSFILNDPHAGALHTPDVYVITPIHYRGMLVAWTASFVNVTDIGAIDAGGFCPRATDSFQEGFSTPGLKLIERGKMRRDIMATILNMVRDPGMVALDMKSQIAASNVAKSRFLDIVERYGWDAVDEVSQALIAQSETLLRRRLAELPDGRWRAREYIDMPGKTYKLRLAMEKKNDELSFDFEGSSEQAPIGINCTYWATYGGVFAPLFPLLCHDITWNDGVTKPVSVVAPEGTIVNCRRPAPVSVATISGLKIVNNLSTLVVSKMLMTSPKYRKDATAVWQGTHTPVFWTGINQFNEFFVTPVTDGFGGSGGARTFSDGVDIGGEIANVFSRWANLETHEQNSPVLYLFRRRLADSGGAGKFRGGVAHEYAVIPHDAPMGEFQANLFTKGVRVPLSHGLSGGYPGNTAETSVFRGVEYLLEDPSRNHPLPTDPESIRGKKESLQWGAFPLRSNEILYVMQVGAGGYGDPLEREAQDVLADASEGLVTAGIARDVYGVEISDEEATTGGMGPEHRAEKREKNKKRVEEEATRLRRGELRRQRRRQSRCAAPSIGKLEGGTEHTGVTLNEYVLVVRSRNEGGLYLQCRVCEHVISGIKSVWKNHSSLRESLVNSVLNKSALHEDQFVLREFFCPGCGTLLEVEVAQRGEELLLDEIYGA